MTGQQDYFLEEIVVGMSEALSKTVSNSDILGFADITGDRNPVHLDDDYAAGSPFKERTAHGMLSAGFISAVLGSRLPGPGCIYLSQSLQFRAPVMIGDEVTASATVTDVDSNRRRVTLETVCKVGDKVVVDGEAQLMVASRMALAAE